MGNVHMYTHTHLCMYHVCMYCYSYVLYLYVYTPLRAIYTCMYTCACAHMRAHTLSELACACIHACADMNITYIHVHILREVCIHMHLLRAKDKIAERQNR